MSHPCQLTPAQAGESFYAPLGAVYWHGHGWGLRGPSGYPMPPQAHQQGCSPSLCLQLASELKGTISSPLQSARSTIGNSMDKIMELAAEGYEATKSTVETTARYTRRNSVSQMAAAGVDTALGGLEKLMEYLLPEEDEEAGSPDAQIPSEGVWGGLAARGRRKPLDFGAGLPTRVVPLGHKPPNRSSAHALLPSDQKPKETRGSAVKVSQQQPSTPSAPSTPSTLGRIGTLVSTVSHRAYQQTTQSLQRAKAKGQELATWIPILVSAKTHPPGSCSPIPSFGLILLLDEMFQAPWSTCKSGVVGAAGSPAQRDTPGPAVPMARLHTTLYRVSGMTYF